VRALRDERGWSQEELAERAGLHRTYLGGIERGLRNVALVNIARIAKAFGLSVSELFVE
jgi:transcriptional regulator with XRE-family HTH domain